MNKLLKSKIKIGSAGFTIIEVVLVLAIAGLIFLMVFIALPTLQKTQRDTQRKQDLSRIETQLTAYSNNNRGQIPADITAGFVKNYLAGTSGTIAGPSYQDPTLGSGYVFQNLTSTTTAPTLVVGQIAYEAGYVCGTDGAFTKGTSRQYALDMFLEGQTVPYCVDSE